MARDINIVLNGYTITDFYNASSPVDPTAQDSFVVNICDGVNCVQQSITQNIYIDTDTYINHSISDMFELLDVCWVLGKPVNVMDYGRIFNDFKEKAIKRFCIV